MLGSINKTENVEALAPENGKFDLNQYLTLYDVPIN